MTYQLLILITLLVLYLISYYFILYIVFSFSVLFSRFRLLPSFSPLSISFLVTFPLLFCFVFCSCFFFGFFHCLSFSYLPVPLVSLSFVSFPFYSFFFSLLRSSLLLLLLFFRLLLCSPPPFSAVSTPSLVDFLFLFFFSVPFFSWLSSSFCFSPLLVLSLLSHPTFSHLHLPLFPLLLFLHRHLLRGVFLSSCFPSLSAVSSFPSPFLFLPILSPDFSYSFGPFSVTFLLSFLSVFPLSVLCYVFLRLPLAGCVLAFCSFIFVSILSPLPTVFVHGFLSLPPSLLYSSAVLLSSMRGSLSAGLSPACPHPSPIPLPPRSLLVPSLFFALPPVLAVPCWSPFFLLLRSSSAFICFTFFPYKSLAPAVFLSLCLCLCLCLSLPVMSLLGVGIPATGLLLRLGSQSFVIFFRLLWLRFL